MADDSSYNTFLTKVNQDPSAGSAHEQSTGQARSKFDPTSTSPKKHSDSGVPPALCEIATTYTSDTDSEFEPVFFSYAADHLPSVAEFQKCLGTKGVETSVNELSVKEFDPRGQYSNVINAVASVGKDAEGEQRGAKGKEDKGVKIFRLEISSTRAEYYIITVGDRKLLGVVAKAVES